MPLVELVSYLFTLIGLSLIILIVAVKNIHTKTNRWFLLFALSVFLYAALSFSSEFAPNLGIALLRTRTALFVANFIPLFFYQFSLAFTGHKSKHRWLSPAFAVATISLAAMAYLPATITSLQKARFGTTLNQPGPLLWLTLVYFVVAFGVSFRILFVHGRSSQQSVRLQIRLILYGIGTSVVINLVTQIALPQFHIVTLGNLLGTPSLVIVVGSVGYAILRHRMFDIRAVILRSFGYLLTIATVTVLYGLIVIGVSSFLLPDLKLTLLEKSYFIGAAVVLTLAFHNLLQLIRKLTDRLFYLDYYDPQELVNQIGRVLASEIELRQLSNQVRLILNSYMRIKQTDIIVLDKGKPYFEAASFFKTVLPAFVESMNQLSGKVIVADDLAEDKHKSMLQKYGISVVASLKTHNEKVGYLLLGEKISGTTYNDNDIQIINIVSDELAIAIQNSRAYTQIEEFNKTLQDKIEQATQQLRDANVKLKETDAVKNDFISMASHELSTPLSVIDGYLALATKGIYGELNNDKLLHSLEAALNRTQLMKGLVDDLLNVSRMTAGKFFLELSPTDLNEVAQNEVNQLQNQAEQKEVKLSYHAPQKPVPVVNIDNQKIRQAMMNLINNALNYAAGKSVTVYLEATDSDIVFRVVDSGMGVPEEQQSKLFTKFFRADNAKKERPNGTGIGLYLVKRVIEDHGGKIIFYSQVGRGSTFGFSLPIKPHQKRISYDQYETS